MGNDFEKLSLKELFTDVWAFLTVSLAIIGAILLIIFLMLWG